MTFKDDNRVELDLHVGCALYVYDDGHKEHLNQVLEFFQAVSTDFDDPAWKLSRSFFISMKAVADFTFTEDDLSEASPYLKMIPGYNH